MRERSTPRAPRARRARRRRSGSSPSIAGWRRPYAIRPRTCGQSMTASRRCKDAGPRLIRTRTKPAGMRRAMEETKRARMKQAAIDAAQTRWLNSRSLMMTASRPIRYATLDGSNRPTPAASIVALRRRHRRWRDHAPDRRLRRGAPVWNHHRRPPAGADRTLPVRASTCRLPRCAAATHRMLLSVRGSIHHRQQTPSPKAG